MTINTGTKPSVFSVLELSTESTKGGLRLPHLIMFQRIDLVFEVLVAKPSAIPEELTLLQTTQQLTIFNTTSQRIEYWDTREWISMRTSSTSFFFKRSVISPIDAGGGNIPLIKPDDGGGQNQNPLYTVDIVAGINYVTNPNHP